MTNPMLSNFLQRMAIARGVFSYQIGRSYFQTDPVFLSAKQIDVADRDDEVVGKHQNQDERKEIILQESDFEEKFVKGSGPGGQKVNKSSNCVELKHKETGIVVKCHESRSLERNRQLARTRLLEKLKMMFLPSQSDAYKKLEKKRKRDSEAVRRRRLKDEAIKNRTEI